ncbi:MAG: YdiU family protein [Myxococcales bacterium]|nr:YdiU family protein [Myxococcales bacterium]
MSDPTDPTLGIRADASYASLPPRLYSLVEPTPVARPELVIFNHALADALGLDVAAAAAAPAVWAGNRRLPGTTPLAQAYAGHQFGHFTRLGDGRAVLLTEHLDRQGRRWDIQLKGSGPTPYSRRGDGRAALGPMLREYVISEAMHALGAPTTRSLAVVRSGERVHRERPLAGAILTRVAASHLRVGTFEFAAASGDREALRALADHAIARHAPEAADAERPHLALYDAVVAAQARLIAQWMALGFVHGVMNTDNMTISGETIDYGPCAFLDAHRPGTVFSSIDEAGRYAYGRQPAIAQWNLARFAEALLPLFDPAPERALELAQEALARFPARYEAAMLEVMRGKLGLDARADEDAEDAAIIESLLEWMGERGVDHTNTFRSLSSSRPGDGARDGDGEGDPAWRAWRSRWSARLARQETTWPEAQARMDAHNPDVIPRNHQVEAALDAAIAGDLGPFERLLAALADPYVTRPEHAPYREPAPADAPAYRTFCGT